MNSLTGLSAGWNRKQAPIFLFAKEKWALLSGAMQIPSSWLIFLCLFYLFFQQNPCTLDFGEYNTERRNGFSISISKLHNGI